LDRRVKDHNHEYHNEAKILLLGSGDSGKSTFLRQIKHINGVDTGLESEKLKFTAVIKNSCLKSFRDFLKMIEAKELKIPPKVQDKINFILNAEEFDEETGQAIEKTWSNKKMRSIYDKVETDMQIPSNSNYFWKMAQTIASEDYLPSKDDIIQSKIRTIGIQETNFVIEQTKFLMIDVGGQRSERRKWLHCFNNISAVIFLTASDEYDGKLLGEDNHTNRLQDSLGLFVKLSESSCFENVPFILFLNKIDLFDAKIKYKPFEDHFDDFIEAVERLGLDGESKRDQSIGYLYNLFKERFKSRAKLFHFETNATDQKLCENVFNSIREDIILKQLTGII